MLRRVPCVRRTETRGDLPPRSCRRRPDDRATDTPIYTAPGMHRIDTVEGRIAAPINKGPPIPAATWRPCASSTDTPTDTTLDLARRPFRWTPSSEPKIGTPPSAGGGCCGRGQPPSPSRGWPLKRQTARSCVRPAGWTAARPVLSSPAAAAQGLARADGNRPIDTAADTLGDPAVSSPISAKSRRVLRHSGARGGIRLH
jgi:hypothetical protein